MACRPRIRWKSAKNSSKGGGDEDNPTAIDNAGDFAIALMHHDSQRSATR